MPRQPQDLRRIGKEGLKASHHYTLSGPGKHLFFLSEAFGAVSMGAKLGDEMGQRGYLLVSMDAAGRIGCSWEGCAGLPCVCACSCVQSYL